jgi:hypothetical protein
MKKTRTYIFGVIKIEGKLPIVKDYKDMQMAQFEVITQYPEMIIYVMQARSKWRLQTFKEHILQKG